MSKMMDNLARVHEEEPENSKKPSLFLVREQAPPAAFSGAPRGTNRKTTIVWTVVCAAVVGLSVMIYQTLPATIAPSMPSAQSPSVGAVELIRSRDYVKAKQVLDEQLIASPGNRAHLINRAYVLKELGNLAASESEYKSLLASKPGDPAVLNNLGALYLRANRFDEAETILRKSADSGYADARLNLAAVLEKKKDWSGALKIFEEILTADDPGTSQVMIRERVRRLRSLSVAASSPKEKF